MLTIIKHKYQQQHKHKQQSTESQRGSVNSKNVHQTVQTLQANDAEFFLIKHKITLALPQKKARSGR